MKDKIFNIINLKMSKLENEELNALNNLKKDKELFGISPICIDILYNRGFKTTEAIKKHLYATLDDAHSPMLLKDSTKFITKVIETLEAGEDIVVYTDYDADGITSGSLGINSLRKAVELTKSKSKINYYTNNRFIEGYGITPKGVDMLIEKFPSTKLIITTDNGIVGYDGIKRAYERDITVLVTDHHDVGETLPEYAYAIVDPKRKDCEYPFKGLCGAGVIFKLMQLLYWELNLDIKHVNEMIDILAVGIVGDLVPLIDENRIYVKEGIKLIKEERRLAFSKLREALSLTTIDEETFGFVYAPLFNALGRITGSPDDGIELLTTDDEQRMNEIISKLVEVNDLRKTLTKEQTELALSVAGEMKEIPNVIVLTHKDFHEGVIGLVATKVRDKYQRPTIILAENEKDVLDENGTIVKQIVLKGSARSIEGFNIKESFDKVKSTLMGYGGHFMAGGLSLRQDRLEEFREAINNYAANILTSDSYKKNILIDAPLSTKEISIDLIEEIQSLKPYGMAFPKPKFGLKDFELDYNLNNKIYIGNEATHVKLVSNNNLTLIMFNGSDRYRYLNEPRKVKAIGIPSINIFKDKVYLQFMVENDYIFNS